MFTRLSSVAVWLLAWAGLVAIYATQELLEELLASGHPGGVAGVLGHGGWWAVPVAAIVAAGITVLQRVARVFGQPRSVWQCPPGACSTLRHRSHGPTRAVRLPFDYRPGSRARGRTPRGTRRFE